MLWFVAPRDAIEHGAVTVEDKRWKGWPRFPKKNKRKKTNKNKTFVPISHPIQSCKTTSGTFTTLGFLSGYEKQHCPVCVCLWEYFVALGRMHVGRGAISLYSLYRSALNRFDNGGIPSLKPEWSGLKISTCICWSLTTRIFTLLKAICYFHCPLQIKDFFNKGCRNILNILTPCQTIIIKLSVFKKCLTDCLQNPVELQLESPSAVVLEKLGWVMLCSPASVRRFLGLVCCNLEPSFRTSE